MRSLKLLLAALVLAVMTTGCAVNRATATVDPSARVDSLKTLHVKHFEKDERGTDKLIADNLRARGYKVSMGNDPVAPVDAVVTYVDKWFWDITMYMLELTVQIRDPKTDYPLATGNSFHTSLTRKAPPEMVDEVVGNIMKEGKSK
ncbi:MAG: hypothetical protein ACJ8GO_20155 [Ramlibacter sp.]